MEGGSDESSPRKLSDNDEDKEGWITDEEEMTKKVLTINDDGIELLRPDDRRTMKNNDFEPVLVGATTTRRQMPIFHLTQTGEDITSTALGTEVHKVVTVQAQSKAQLMFRVQGEDGPQSSELGLVNTSIYSTSPH